MMSTTATSTESGYKGGSFVFDSYTYVRRLRDAGMDEQQAAIQAEAFMALAEDRLATKQDIVELKRDIETTKAELKRDIETTKAELKRDIETTRAELKRDMETIQAALQKDIAMAKVTTIQWTAGMFVAQTALILGALFAVMKMNQPPAYHPPAQALSQPALPPATAPLLPPAAPPPPARQ